MKRGTCSRCGKNILVPQTHRDDEDMAVCWECDRDLARDMDEQRVGE